VRESGVIEFVEKAVAIVNQCKLQHYSAGLDNYRLND
jgi:hypothetical protein